MIVTQLQDVGDTLIPQGAVTLRDDVRVQERDGILVVSHRGRDVFRLSGVNPGVRDILARLAEAPMMLADVFAELGSPDRLQFARVTKRLWTLMARSVLFGDRETLRIEPRSSTADYDSVEISPCTPVKLSAFAYLHVRDGAMVVDSPLATWRCIPLGPAAGAMILALCTCTTAADLASDDLPSPVVTEMLAHLVGAGFVDVGEKIGSVVRFETDRDEVLRQWEFHDLLLHSLSRGGRHDEPSGALFPFVGQVEPEPAVKPKPPGSALELYKPSLARIRNSDPSLVSVMETRRSVRVHGDRPINARQVGEFLYRVARIRATRDPLPPKVPYETSTRPYPSGGAIYELEIYLTVGRCEGLGEGIYYYAPEHHQLCLVNGDPADRDWMMKAASMAAGGGPVPDIAITITSRFQRQSWKYRSIAYAVTLKNVGVLFQSMYLVATAMGLAPCALGSGGSDGAARILGLDYLRESPVGEFMLSSLPEIAARPMVGQSTERWHPVNDHEWQTDTSPIHPVEDLYEGDRGDSGVGHQARAT